MVTETSNPMVPSLFRIRKRWKETSDTFTLILESADGQNEFSFLPGQFNMLYPFGHGEVPISISGDPCVSNGVVHTIRNVGTVTNALSELKKGDMIGVRGPYGTGWPIQETKNKDVVIVAGGLGIAPLRPLIYHIISNRDYYGHVVIIYGARSPKEILYRKELEKWRGRFDLEVEVTVDTARGNWRGNVGVVTKFIGKAGFEPLKTSALICGPEVMMHFTIQELEKRGVGPDRTYLSMERNMKCAVGFCGRCQFGPYHICKDGPVFRFDKIMNLFGKREV
ncbi:MAG: FAD/NAD(P)-binding protein [Candidatus Hydrothermarchaeales archaeon]